MTVEHVLARYAERGSSRGAALVWEQAVGAGPAPAQSASPRPPRRQRVALLATTLGLLVLGGLAVRGVGSALLAPAPRSAGDATDVGNDDDPELPPALIIEGMTLVRVDEPQADLPGPERITGEPGRYIRTQIFADSDGPASGPIIGIRHLFGGGFEPWGANLGATDLASFTDGLRREGDAWVLDDSHGLEQVADLAEGDPLDLARFGWQLDFRGDGHEAAIQHEPTEHSSIWLWLARLLTGSGVGGGGMVVEAVQVGSSGQGLALIGPIPEDGSTPTVEVVWESEGWVHRLTLGRIEGDTMIGTDARIVVDDLVIDRARWSAAVDDARGWRPGARSSLILLVEAVTVIALILAAAAFVRRPGAVAAAVIIVGLAVLAAAYPDGTVVLVAALVGLLMALARPDLGRLIVGAVVARFRRER